MVFPDYFYGQINEAKHEYGTFSLPSKLTMELLEATVAEIGRNGFKRIIIINGHGGNPQMIRYFIQNQLESKRNYAVYFFEPNFPPEVTKKINEMRQSDPSTDMHGGEKETSVLLYIKPEVLKKTEPRKNLELTKNDTIYPVIYIQGFGGMLVFQITTQVKVKLQLLNWEK